MSPHVFQTTYFSSRTAFKQTDHCAKLALIMVSTRFLIFEVIDTPPLRAGELSFVELLEHEYVYSSSLRLSSATWTVRLVFTPHQ